MKKIILLFIFFQFIYFLTHKVVYAVDWTVCLQEETGCSHSGTDAIQLAVNEAKDNDTIFIKTGKYTSDINRDCFVDLGSKKLTLAGEGSPIGAWNGTVLYGEGHAKPDIYPKRAGLCSNGGNITIKNIHIREFQGGGINFTSSQLTIYNSVIDTNDSGGVLLRNTSLLAVNNIFYQNGIIRNGQAPIKAIANTFIGKAIDGNCNEDVGPLDFINNIVSDSEELIGLGNIWGNCKDKVDQYKSKNIKNNILWHNNTECWPTSELCDFTINNNVYIDPKLDIPCQDAAGWMTCGGNTEPKTDSPALNAANFDSTIPGIRNIGAAGGPCVNSADATCTTFIQNNQPHEPIAATPTPDNNPPANNNPPDNNNPPNSNPPNNQTQQNLFGIPLPLSRLIDVPNNYLLPNVVKTTESISSEPGIFDLSMYIVFSLVYIMVMHLAINMGSEFSLGFMVSFFVLGGVIGGWLNTYESGFVVAAILSLIFIGGPKKEM